MFSSVSATTIIQGCITAIHTGMTAIPAQATRLALLPTACLTAGLRGPAGHRHGCSSSPVACTRLPGLRQRNATLLWPADNLILTPGLYHVFPGGCWQLTAAKHLMPAPTDMFGRRMRDCRLQQLGCCQGRRQYPRTYPGSAVSQDGDDGLTALDRLSKWLSASLA